jgi:hypothetical protein
MKDLKVPLRSIAVDTLRKATPGKDENSSKTLSPQCCTDQDGVP